MKIIKLSDRLNVIADLIEKDASVADIGTNHGYLPVYLAQTGLAKKIIAADISPASLEAARSSAKIYGVTDSINFLVADGLNNISPADIDSIVISGMGGETILGILKNAPWTKNGIKLILQPQSKTNLLCKFLYDNAYKIKIIKSITEKEKHYTVINCVGGELV